MTARSKAQILADCLQVNRSLSSIMHRVSDSTSDVSESEDHVLNPD